jgi:hypothetical protein
MVRRKNWLEQCEDKCNYASIDNKPSSKLLSANYFDQRENGHGGAQRNYTQIGLNHKKSEFFLKTTFSFSRLFSTHLTE